MKRYEVIVGPQAESGYRFYLKKDAIEFAAKYNGFAYIKNRQTNQITRLLPRDKCNCQVCGNELNGKKHCSFCGQLHYYL